jgi:glucoamylase
LHAGVRTARAALAVAAVVAAGAILVSGGSDADPVTPPALPGLPPPFLGTAVTGDGRMTAAVDAYGDVVNLYAPGPAGAAEIANPSARQEAGTVPSNTGIVPRVRIGEGPALPLWRAEAVRQSHIPGTNAVRTVARFGGGTTVTETVVARGEELAVLVGAAQAGRGGAGTGRGDGEVRASLGVNVAAAVECREGRPRDDGPNAVALLCGRDGERRGEPGAGRDRPAIGSGADAGAVSSGGDGTGGAAVYAAAAKTALLGAAADRRWLARARPLGAGAPAWARAMYERSLLTLRALSGRNGAAAAGAREGWAYVWPRDAASAAIALQAAGYPGEARRGARFLSSLPLTVAARFDETGASVPGRGPQGDEAGWVAAAERATGFPESAAASATANAGSNRWRDLPDYQEGAPGDYLGNAIAAAGTPPVDGPKTAGIGGFSARQRDASAAVIAHEFGTARRLVRQAGDPGSGLDSAAAWAVRPFALRPLYPAARTTLLRLASHATRYGITPGEGWTGGEDPWTAPTAASAWALAALAREEGGAPAAAAGPSAAAVRPAEPGRDPAAQRAAADRRAALGLLADLRRAATPAGALPERIDAQTGLPRSTTPLLWSAALAALTLRELWPGRSG